MSPWTRTPLPHECARTRNGAVVTFLGTTRSSTDDRKVLHLEYEAYEPMARKKLAEIADKMRERWEVDVAIAHRLGRLEIGETSLVVAVASPHRSEAFAACQYSVDRIKQTVPIWKKEFFEGGEGLGGESGGTSRCGKAPKLLPDRSVCVRSRIEGLPPL